MAKWYERLGGATLGSGAGAAIGMPLIGAGYGFNYDSVKARGGQLGGKISNAWDDYTGVTSEEVAKDAAEIQAQAGLDAMAQEKKMYDQNRADAAPWMESGKKSLAELEAGIGSGRFDMDNRQFDDSQYTMPDQMDEFSFTMDDFQDSPYYQFLQDEGAKNVNRSAAAGGRLGGGDTLNALQQRGQMTAMNEFGNQYNRALGGYDRNMGRYQTELGKSQYDRDFGYGQFMDDYNREASQKANQYNRLAGLSGTGQMQSQYIGGLGEGYGSRTSDMMTQIANAKAAGMVGGANARMSGMEELASHAKEAGKSLIQRGGGSSAPARSKTTIQPYQQQNYQYQQPYQQQPYQQYPYSDSPYQPIGRA